VPVECYRNYVVTRLSGPTRPEFLRALPPATLRELVKEMQAILRS
jgi:hypothetical protein